MNKLKKILVGKKGSNFWKDVNKFDKFIKKKTKIRKCYINIKYKDLPIMKKIFISIISNKEYRIPFDKSYSVIGIERYEDKNVNTKLNILTILFGIVLTILFVTITFLAAYSIAAYGQYIITFIITFLGIAISILFPTIIIGGTLGYDIKVKKFIN